MDSDPVQVVRQRMQRGEEAEPNRKVVPEAKESGARLWTEQRCRNSPSHWRHLRKSACPSAPVAAIVLSQIQRDRPFQEAPRGKGLGVVEPRAVRLSRPTQEVPPRTLGEPDTLRLLAWGTLVSPLLALTWNAGNKTWAWGGTGWGQLSNGSEEGHSVQCPECAPACLHISLSPTEGHEEPKAS